jgi:hypothetical protein
MTEKGTEVELEGEVTEACRVSPHDLRRGRTDTDLGGSAAIRIRGTILWFNVVKDIGVLRLEDGERIEVPGTAFLPGERPVGRCAGKAIEFEALEGAVAGVAFVPEPSPRRARLHRRR